MNRKILFSFLVNNGIMSQNVSDCTVKRYLQREKTDPAVSDRDSRLSGRNDDKRMVNKNRAVQLGKIADDRFAVVDGLEHLRNQTNGCRGSPAKF
jgi:hypothetical protein